MSRVQLALNVADLDQAVAFYTTLLGTGPAKVRPGYANFAVDQPPLKLVLMEGQGDPGTLNHLGIEVGDTAAVTAATARLAAEGLATATEDEVACCYAVQDKVWVDGPDGEPWEIYTVLADTEHTGDSLRTAAPDGDAACCTPTVDQAGRRRLLLTVADPTLRVVFLCVHNAGRSQMALGWFDHLADGEAIALSAGSEPAREVNQVAVAAMAEVGIDISRQVPQRWTDAMIGAADVVISMGCGDTCPLVPGTRYEDWVLADPAGADLDAVRPIRDEIEARVRTLLAQLGDARG